MYEPDLFFDFIDAVPKIRKLSFQEKGNTLSSRRKGIEISRRKGIPSCKFC
jgi:hypothetical protein